MSHGNILGMLDAGDKKTVGRGGSYGGTEGGNQRERRVSSVEDDEVKRAKCSPADLPGQRAIISPPKTLMSQRRVINTSAD